jgi:carbohydrate kinase (thermoresistant glucokinase family)
MTNEATPPIVILVMGVAGCGKTTVGRLLAEALGAAYEEGDAYHTPKNVAKMNSGTPLTDADRWPWLEHLAASIDGWLAQGKPTVLACSALKQSYRDILIGDRRGVALVYLKGSETLIRGRLEKRRDHYMPADLLASQFATLEEPDHAITVDVSPEPSAIVQTVLARLHVGAPNTKTRS